MAMSWRSILSIFTFIAEVAALTALEVFTAGGATPLVAMGIGLLGATTRLAIDATDTTKGGIHGINVLGTVLDFAGALIPGLSGFKNARTGAKLLVNAEKEVTSSLTKSNKLLFRGMDRTMIKKTAAQVEERLNMFDNLTGKFTGGLTKTKGAQMVRDVERTNMQMLSASRRYGKRAFTFDTIKNNIKTGWNHGSTSLKNQMQKLAGVNRKEANALYKTLTRSTKKVSPVNFDMDIVEVAEIVFRELPKEKAENLMKILESSQFLRSGDLTFVAKAFAKSLTPGEAKALQTASITTEELILNSAGKLSSKQIRGSSFAEKIRYLGSKSFNDKVIQKVQLIDPNDLGRAPVEWAYGKVKKFIEDKLFKKEVNEMTKKGVKGLLKGRNKIEQAFEKAGGQLVPRNRYLLGYKPIPGAKFGGEHLVMLVFNKLSTSPREHNVAYKNNGGKRDVFVRMTRRDMKRLTNEGVSYYWDVGRKKGWYRSRGGKQVKGSLSHSLSPALSLFLGFVPIAPLRLGLSGVSNLVENGTAIAEGTYFSNYIAKLERSFVRSVVNRSARLLARTIIGGKVLKDTGKRWVGRELQRLASTNLSFFEGTNSKTGFFEFKGWKTSRGKSRSAAYINRVALGATVGAKSGVLRGSRGRGHGIAAKHISNVRNLKNIGRIGSAVTPNRVNNKTFYNTKSIFTLKW